MNTITTETLNKLRLCNVNSINECEIEDSKDGKYVVRLVKDGKSIYIGSKYSVSRDIQIFMKDLGEYDSKTVFIIFGLGTGEHIKDLKKNAPDNKVLVVEPDINIIKELIEKKVFISSLNEIEDIAIYYFEDVSFTDVLDSFIEPYETNNLKVVFYSNYNKLFSREYEKFCEKVNFAINNKEIKNQTLKVFSKHFFSNFTNNIRVMGLGAVITTLYNRFKNETAVIVSAGPSLEKNIHELKYIQEKVIIITGPRTVGALLKNGIQPDFICAVDPQEICYTMMEEHIDATTSSLVYLESSNFDLVAAFEGKEFLCASKGMEHSLQEIIGKKVDSILEGGSVAHTCMGLGVYLGCNKIIFIGQDLAYTNEKFQASSTNVLDWDDWKERFENNKKLWDKTKDYSIFVKDICGNPIRTSVILNMYRHEFELLIKKHDEIEFINSTEGGAHIDGTIVLTLKEAIYKYVSEKRIDKNLEYQFREGKIDEQFIEFYVIELIEKLKILRVKSYEGIEYSEMLKKYYMGKTKVSVNYILKKLDYIDRYIEEVKKIGLITYILGNAIQEALVSNSRIEESGLEIRNQGIRIAEKSKLIYSAIYETIGNLLNELEFKDIKEVRVNEFTFLIEE